jgi:hypothetical protein
MGHHRLSRNAIREPSGITGTFRDRRWHGQARRHGVSQDGKYFHTVKMDGADDPRKVAQARQLMGVS